MAIGFGVCIVSRWFNKWIAKIIKRTIQRVIIFTSGVFFATFELPEYAKPL